GGRRAGGDAILKGFTHGASSAAGWRVPRGAIGAGGPCGYSTDLRPAVDASARPWYQLRIPAPLLARREARGRRTRPGTVPAVLHGDVGAVQLLLHAGPADAVHGRADAGGRPRLPPLVDGADLRPVQRPALLHAAAGRADRGPLLGLLADDHRR